MNISNYLSDKIKVLSFLLTVFIVVLHTNMEMLTTGCVSFIQQMMTAEVTRVAVPLFYLISGFLFYINYNGSLDDYKRKLKSRTRSLLVPYFLFLFIGSIVVFIIGRSYSLDKFLEIIKGGIMNSPPVFYPLWFIRDLYVMVVLSPIVYWMVKKVPILLVIPVIIWALGKNPFVFPMTEAMLFFSLGGFLTTKYKLLERINPNGAWLLFSLWIILCFLNAFIGRYVRPLPYITHCIVLSFGIYAIWTLYDRLYPKLSEQIRTADIYKYSFFIYLIHEPVLTIVKKSGLYLLGKSSWSIAVIYLLAPIITICTIYMVGQCMNRYTPRVLMFITGGRTNRT